MTDATTYDFDFEELARLAIEDPDAFEQRRSQLVEGMIRSAPEEMHKRLRGLQWQLDQVRGRAGTPMAACMDMSRLMWDKVLGEDGLLDSMHSLNARGTELRDKPAAAVLEFPGKPDD